MSNVIRRVMRAALWGGSIAYFVHLIRTVNAKPWPVVWKVETICELVVLAVLGIVLAEVVVFAWRLLSTEGGQHA